MIEKMITREYLEMLDQDIKMIPLTFDYAFKMVFNNNLDLLKKFLIETLELGLEPDDCKITILNNELPKENHNEYKKIVDINIVLNKDIYIEIELNRSSYQKVQFRNSLYESKLYSLLLEEGDDPRELKNKIFYQLNLNTENKSIPYGEDIIVPYGKMSKKIYDTNKYTILKYIAFYRKVYYNENENLSYDEIWLVSLTSECFTELYDILSNILSDSELDRFIKDVIRMSNDNFSIHAWEKEKMDELLMYEEFEAGKKEGIVQGIEKNTIDTIKSMVKNNIEFDIISKITSKSIDEIKEIEKSIKD